MVAVLPLLLLPQVVICLCDGGIGVCFGCGCEELATSITDDCGCCSRETVSDSRDDFSNCVDPQSSNECRCTEIEILKVTYSTTFDYSYIFDSVSFVGILPTDTLNLPTFSAFLFDFPPCKSSVSLCILYSVLRN
jgi:hypothetical protein